MEQDDPRSQGLGRAIRVIRAGRDMSRKHLAKRSGLSYSYVAEIETGAKSPSSKALALIARALGVALHELMEAAERWEHAPPPHSFEELRDSTRMTLLGDPAASLAAAPRTSLRMASARREMLRRREPPAPETPLASEELELGDVSLEMPEQARKGQTGHLRELLELLETLGPDDRERLLDLARRLAAER
jgi:transcriptional regulator with XRE-family HTH domain